MNSRVEGFIQEPRESTAKTQHESDTFDSLLVSRHLEVGASTLPECVCDKRLMRSREVDFEARTGFGGRRH